MALIKNEFSNMVADVESLRQSTLGEEYYKRTLRRSYALKTSSGPLICRSSRKGVKAEYNYGYIFNSNVQLMKDAGSYFSEAQDQISNGIRRQTVMLRGVKASAYLDCWCMDVPRKSALHPWSD